MNLRVVNREFRDVPQRVRDFHGVGTILLLVEVDLSGKATRANVIRGLGRDVNEYAKSQVLAWKFKPMTRTGQPINYRGMVSIPFWYGAFDERTPS
jgi:TonB family protein